MSYGGGGGGGGGVGGPQQQHYVRAGPSYQGNVPPWQRGMAPREPRGPGPSEGGAPFGSNLSQQTALATYDGDWGARAAALGWKG